MIKETSKTVTKTHSGGTLTEYFDNKGNRIRAIHITGKLIKSVNDDDEDDITSSKTLKG